MVVIDVCNGKNTGIYSNDIGEGNNSSSNSGSYRNGNNRIEDGNGSNSCGLWIS